MSTPGGVYPVGLTRIDYSVRQGLLLLWLSEGNPLSLASLDMPCVRQYTIDPRALNKGTDRSQGMAMLGWLECG